MTMMRSNRNRARHGALAEWIKNCYCCVGTLPKRKIQRAREKRYWKKDSE